MSALVDPLLPRRCPVCRRPGLFIGELMCRDCAKAEKIMGARP